MQTAVETSEAALGGGGDADLLRLAWELDDAFRREWEAHERARVAESRGHPFNEHEAEAERIVDESDAIAESMVILSATTQAGLFAKARAGAWCLGEEDDLTLALREEGTALDVRLARSIVRDLLRMQSPTADGASKMPTTEAQRVPE
jgi:hypothetical protein